jgi:GTP-binding protein HflX
MIENKEHDYEYAVLIGIINQEQSAQQVSDYMDELAFLTLTAGGEVKKRFTQN